MSSIKASSIQLVEVGAVTDQFVEFLLGLLQLVESLEGVDQLVLGFAMSSYPWARGLPPLILLSSDLVRPLFQGVKPFLNTPLGINPNFLPLFQGI